jgi:stalled ribosome alternative rescue factor ArfA
MEKDKKEKKKDNKAKKALNHSLFRLWSVVCANR